jgi:lipopolysaccharide biosynthesis glycosyltransferase
MAPALHFAVGTPALGEYPMADRRHLDLQAKISRPPGENGSAPEPIVLATCGSNTFVMPMAVMLHSALCHIPPAQPVRIFLVEDGVTPANRARLERVVHKFPNVMELTWITPAPDALADVPVTPRYGRACFLRLLLPGHVPPDVTRLIYLDGDMVVESDLSELWRMDMGSAPALAVENYSSPYASHSGSLAETYMEEGVPADAPYCNTGFLLMNVTMWREEKLVPRMLDFVKRQAQYVRNADQDGINAVIGARWGLLDPRWNVQILTIQTLALLREQSTEVRKRLQTDVLKQAHILHYVGHIKPWTHRYRRQRGDRFLHYANGSGWFSPAHGALWSASRYLSQTSLFWMAWTWKAALRLVGGRD